MDKTITFLVTLKLLFLIPQLLLSCSCNTESIYYPFCNSALSNFRTAVAIEAIVIDQPKPHNLKVLILDQLDFTTEEDTILILGQNGHNCGQVTSIFEINDTVILRLLNDEKIDDVNNDEVYNWYLDGCFLSYLNIKNGYVRGFIREGVDLETIEDFKQNIEACLSFEVGFPITEYNIKIYPNPFINKVLIEGVTENISFVEVCNTNGQKVICKTLKNANNIELFLEENTAGLYFINIHTDDYVITKKILKE